MTETSTPDTPVRSSLPRRLIFAIVTTISFVLMAAHFVAIPKTVAAQGGNKLNEAALTVIDKVVLVSQWDVVKPHAAAFARDPADLLSIYEDHIAEADKAVEAARTDTSTEETERLARVETCSARALRLRERYIVLLAALGERSRAAKETAGLASQSANAEVATALRDAFSLDQTDGTPSALPPKRSKRDAEVLEQIEGWPGQVASLALAKRVDDRSRAAALETSLQEQARNVAVQLAIIGGVFGMNFVLGLIVLVVWLARGRTWDVRSLPPDVPGADAGASLDPLFGWSMLLAFQLVSATVGSVAGAFLAHGEGPLASRGSVLGVLGVQLVIYAIMLGLIGWGIRFRFETIGLHLRRPFRSALCGLGLFLGAFIIILGVGWLMSRLLQGSNAQNNPMFQILDAAGGSAQVLALLALVAFLGPLFEEILFRGVIYTSMRQVMSAPLAIVLNGLLFSAVHGDLNTLVPLASLGMLLAYGFERTRSLATSTVCHCLWNAQTFIFVLLLFS